MYWLSGFDVTRRTTSFVSLMPLSPFDSPVVQHKSIPTEMFRFPSYDQLLALANTNRQLPDILGELTAIRSTINDGTHGSQCVMVTLRVERNMNVYVSLFDCLAFASAEKMTS